MSSNAPKASAGSEKVTFEVDTSSKDDARVAQDVRAVQRDQAVPPYDQIQDDDLKEDEGATARNRTLLTSDEERKLFKRIDIRLLPLLAVMYVVKTMDAANVSNARIMDRGTKHNIMTELGMSANDYNFVTVAYYIPYIVAEAPSNLLLKYFSPSVWQARVMVSWGIVLVCHAAVTNAGGLYTVRALLGLFEAGLWPGILLQLCYWYRPDEIAKRIVLVTVLGNFSAVFGGLLAFGFNGVNTAGLSSWKWLILTEGIFTTALGVVVYFYLPDFPGTVEWLTDKEKTFLEARLPSASPRSEESDFDWQEFKNTLKDYRLWLFVFVWAFYTIGTTGLTFYQPTVIADLGFTTVGHAQLLTIPPAVFSCMLVLFFGWVVQTARIPTPSVPMFFMIAIEVCYVVEYTYPNIGGVYAATMLAGGFSTAWYNLMWPWRVQTISGATGSAFAIAFANSYGQIGGAVGAQLFNSKYAPKYTTSFAIAMGFVGLAIVTAGITWYFTGKVDVETRKIRRARIAAAKENKAVLDDVEVKDVRSDRV